MNQVSAWGSTQFKRTTAEMVVNFCIQRLMPRMKTLDICVQLSNDMEHADGYCLAVDSREFVIEIDSRLKGDDFITALTHEMVHVKQYARGETKDVNMFTKAWKGDEFISMYSTVDEYMALPWEKEAYELQEVLCNEYKQLKLKEIKK
jgi:hypothetical protein